jgi:hypothetical protein
MMAGITVTVGHLSNDLVVDLSHYRYWRLISFLGIISSITIHHT